MEESFKLLQPHTLNLARRRKGEKTADMIWPWGQGRLAKLPSVTSLWGLRGSVISAVNLIHGIGVSAGFTVELVEQGLSQILIDTNITAK